MGSGMSSSDSLLKVYKKYGLVSNKVEGGKENPVLGGLVDIEKYLTQPLSSAKKSLIRDIAMEMSEKLKIPGLDPKDKSIDEIIEQLKKHVPDPRPGKGNRKTWSDKGANQLKACKIIGEIINGKFQNEIVNLDAKPEEICEDVAEIVYSLFTGLHEEFLVIKNDVERILKNIKILEDFVEKGYNVLINRINADKESNLGVETAVIQEAHKDAMTELNRQKLLLENMLNVVIKPTEKDMEELFKESTELKNLVKKIKQYPGTSKFGEKIAYLMSGLKTAAAAAKVVDKALEKVGLTYQEYSKLRDFKKLKDILDKRTQEKLRLPEKDLEAYERAKEILYKYQYLHDEIIDELKKHKYGEVEGKCEEPYTGGSVTGGLKLDKRIKRRQELKKYLLKSFNQRLSGLFDKVLISGKQIGEYVGSGKLPLSDNLDKFVRALDEIPDIQKKYIYFSLSGFYDSVQAKQEREQFVGHVKYLNSVIDDLLKDKEYERIGSFKDMKMAFEEIIKLIEDFSSKFAEGFGTLTATKGGSPNENTKKIVGLIEKAPGALQKITDITKEGIEAGKKLISDAKDIFKTMEEPKTGNEEDDIAEIEGGGEEILPEITKIAYMLERTKEVIRYTFRTSKIRDNLSKFSTEIKSYGEDYIKILADAIASSVDSVIEEKNKYLAPGYDNDNTTHPLRALYREYTDGLQGSALDTAKEKFSKVLEFIAKEFDTKIELYRVAEAVDLYMKAYADAVASHPNDIQDLIHILSSTEIVSKWSTEKSGDFLCQVFDTFPEAFDGHVARYNRLNETYSSLGDDHYYLRVASVCKFGQMDKLRNSFTDYMKNSNDWGTWITNRGLKDEDLSQSIHSAVADEIGLPGNPFLGLPIVGDDIHNGLHAVKCLEKALSVSLLKNIMAMFFNIGKKFGGKDLDSQVFMRPIQIYRSLQNYLIYGSFTFGTLQDVMQAGYTDYYDPNIFVDLDLERRANPNQVMANNKTFRDNNHIRLGLTAESMAISAHGGAGNPEERRKAYITLRGIGNYANPNLKDIFKQDCNLLFGLIIKSIVAKVLTTIGVYNMFHKPINKDGLGYPSDLRMILGGLSDIPKIIPEALELYVRLPLLAEFYREIFKFEDESKVISLVPEFDGIFSGLINLIFDKARYVKHGEYSSTDIQTIIEEVNKIYLKFSSQKNPINEAIKEFVADVNRRYGVIKREERTRYLKERRDRFEYRYETPEELTDFELQGMDESDDYPRPAPSMSYQTVGGPGVGLRPQHKYKLDLETDMGNIDELRKSINDIFKESKEVLRQESSKENQETLDKKISFSGLLRARAEELKYAKTEKEKFDIVHLAINSLGEFSMSALEKSLIMFHESVIHPLNNLYAVYKILNDFNAKIDSFDNCLKQIGVDESDEDYKKSWLGKENARPTLWNDTAGAPAGLGDAIDFGYVEGAPPAFTHNDDWNKAIRPFMNNIQSDEVPFAYGQIPVRNVSCYRGRQGLPLRDAANMFRDLRYDDLNNILRKTYEAYTANQNTENTERFKRAKELVRRFVIDQGKLFTSLFETLFSHSSAFAGLVELKMEVQKAYGSGKDAGKIGVKPGDTCNISCYVDHSKLFQNITEIFNEIKQNVDKFRGLIPKDIISKYEEIGGGNNKYGTLYWIEKNLILSLIQGRREKEEGRIITIDIVNTKIRRILDYLTKAWTVDARGTIIAAGGPNLWHQNDDYSLPTNAKIIRLKADGTEGADPADVEPTGKSYHEFDRELARLIYFDPFNINNDFPDDPRHYSDLRSYHYPKNERGRAIFANNGAYQPARTSDILETILFNTSKATKQGVEANNPWVPLTKRYMLYDKFSSPTLANTNGPVQGTWSKGLIYDDAYRSILIQFNRLVAAYIHQVYDYTTKKVYSTTINGFANGAFSSAVMGDRNFDDSTIEPANNILSLKDKYQGVLFKTLAIVLRQLITEMDEKTSKKQYFEADLNEIPLFVRERYRANLPIFAKLFHFLVKRCEALKHMVKGLNVVQQINISSTAINLRDAGVELSNPDFRNNAVSRSDNEKNLLSILDQVIQGCISFEQCIKDTLTEVDVEPKYLEFYHGSISVYENENGASPFMPLSSLAYYLKNLDLKQKVQHDNVQAPMMPTYELGDNRFKLLYGSRKVLSSELIKLDDMPGMKDIIKQHNYSADSRHHFEEKYMEKFLQHNINLARYASDFKHYLSFFNSFYLDKWIHNPQRLIDAFVAAAIAANRVADAAAAKERVVLSHAFTDFVHDSGINQRNAVYQLQSFPNILNTQLSDVVALTESNFQKEQKNKIADIVQSVEGCPYRKNRKALLAFNIIDLNIVPINIHALMREIPLINLMNYGHTYDHLISELFGLDNIDKSKTKLTLNDIVGNKDDSITEKEPAKKLLGILLINPYIDVDSDVYDHYVSAIIRGSLGVQGLGRPKYLGDQIYNKVLFGEIYPGKVYVEEGGPPVGVGHLRGKQEILADLSRDILGKSYRNFAGALIREITTALMTYQNVGNGIGLSGAPNNNQIYELNEIIKHIVNAMIGENGEELPAGLDDLVRANAINIRDDTGNEAFLPYQKRLLVLYIMIITHLLNMPKFKNILMRNINSLFMNVPSNLLSDPNRLNMLTNKAYANGFLTIVSNILVALSLVRINQTDANVYNIANVRQIGLVDIISDADLNAYMRRLFNGLIRFDTNGFLNPIDLILDNHEKYAEIFINAVLTVGRKIYIKLSNESRKNIELNNPDYFPQSLHFLEPSENNEVKEVALDTTRISKRTLQFLGRLRFNTVLIRNLFWLTNIQRALRLKLRRDLSWYDTKVVKDLAVSSPSITESFGNNEDYSY